MGTHFERAGERFTLHFERDLDHAPEKVWRVLTERELVKQWFPADIQGVWTPGSPLIFTFLHGEGEGLPEEAMRGEVLKADPPSLLEFSWGDHVIRSEIIPEGGGSRLRFSATFDDPSWGARDAAGWEFCLHNLEVILVGGSPAGFDWALWRKKFDHYVQVFTPEFGEQEDPPENMRPEGT